MGLRIQRYAGPKMNDAGSGTANAVAILAGAGRGDSVVRDSHPALLHNSPKWPALSGTTRTALFISLVLALLVYLARAATAFAALTGGVITAVLTLAPLPSSGLASWSHSALPSLLALFLLTFAATRFGRGKKQRLGVAEDKRGRNAAQVAANLGVAGLGAAAR